MLSKPESSILESALLAAAQAGHQIDRALTLLRRETEPGVEPERIRAAMPGAIHVNDESRLDAQGGVRSPSQARNRRRRTGTSPVAWLTSWLWRLVFCWKQRTGWLDLGEIVTATGVVVDHVPPGLDGDRTFAVKLDPGQDRLITGFGGRLTAEDPAVGPSLHCEIEPWSGENLEEIYACMKVGDRVRVTGHWGFDGVHLGVPMWREVIAAAIRHQPNVREGWFEIHPVETLEILS